MAMQTITWEGAKLQQFQDLHQSRFELIPWKEYNLMEQWNFHKNHIIIDTLSKKKKKRKEKRSLKATGSKIIIFGYR